VRWDELVVRPVPSPPELLSHSTITNQE